MASRRPGHEHNRWSSAPGGWRRGSRTGHHGRVRTAESLAALERFLAARGEEPSALDAAGAADAMISWYLVERADDVDLDDGGDMLLFQWGTRDWGGRSFEYDITRQLTLPEEEDGDVAMWHLSLTLHYPPDAPMVALGSGSQWCMAPAEAPGFRELIERADATRLARATTPARVEVQLGRAD